MSVALRGFSDRLRRGEIFSQRVFNDLEGMGFVVDRNGQEYQHKRLLDNLRSSIDPGSLSIRFQPDAIINAGPGTATWYIEVKDSDKIERLAYENYMRLCQLGCVVVCVLAREDSMTKQRTIRWQFVPEIVFIDSQLYVNLFPHPFPVVDGWITPRASCFWHKIKWDNEQGSGTPYRVVDMTKTRSWASFRDVYNEQLRRG